MLRSEPERTTRVGAIINSAAAGVGSSGAARMASIGAMRRKREYWFEKRRVEKHIPGGFPSKNCGWPDREKPGASRDDPGSFLCQSQLLIFDGDDEAAGVRARSLIGCDVERATDLEAVFSRDESTGILRLKEGVNT